MQSATFTLGWGLKGKPVTPHVFALTLPQRAYHFASDTDFELQEWQLALEDALGMASDSGSQIFANILPSDTSDNDVQQQRDSDIGSTRNAVLAAGIGLPTSTAEPDAQAGPDEAAAGVGLPFANARGGLMPAIRETAEDGSAVESIAGSIAGSRNASAADLQALQQQYSSVSDYAGISPSERASPANSTGNLGGFLSSALNVPGIGRVDANGSIVSSASALESASGPAAAAGGAAASAADEDPNVTFEVVAPVDPASSSSSASTRTYSMVVKKSKLAKRTIGKIKKNLSKAVGREAADMLLYTSAGGSGASRAPSRRNSGSGTDDAGAAAAAAAAAAAEQSMIELADDWTADDIQLGDYAVLQLRFKSGGGVPAVPSSATAGAAIAAAASSSADVDASLLNSSQMGVGTGSVLPPPAPPARRKGRASAPASAASSAAATAAAEQANAVRATAESIATALQAAQEAAAEAAAQDERQQRQLEEEEEQERQEAEAAAAAAAEATRQAGVVDEQQQEQQQYQWQQSSPTALSARLDKRMRVRRLFSTLAAAEDLGYAPMLSPSAFSSFSGGGAASPERRGLVGRADLAATLSADAEVSTWPEYESIINRLLSTVDSAGNAVPDVIGWSEVTSLLSDVQEEAATLPSASEPAAIAAASAASTSKPALVAASPGTSAAAAAAAASARAINSGRLGTSSLPSSPLATQAPVSAQRAASPSSPRPSLALAAAGSATKAAAVSPTSASASPRFTGSGAAAVVPIPASVLAYKSRHAKQQLNSSAQPIVSREVVLEVEDGPGGRIHELVVRLGDDPEAVAAEFVEYHGLPPEDHAALVELIRPRLMQCYDDELAEIRRVANDAVVALELANSRLASSSPAASTKAVSPRAAASSAEAAAALEAAESELTDAKSQISGLTARISLLEAELSAAHSMSQQAQANVEIAASTAAAAMKDQAELIETLSATQSELKAAREEIAALAAAHERNIEELRSNHGIELESIRNVAVHLEESLRAAQADAVSAREEVERLKAEFAEKLKKKSAWERYVDGSSGSPDADGALDASAASAAGLGVTMRDLYGHGGRRASTATTVAAMQNGDWRQWAAEKREILARGNAAKAALIEENKRLRSALDSRGLDTEAKLRSIDEERATNRAEITQLGSAKTRAEHELRGVYKAWEEDGRRWATERKHLLTQIDTLLTGTSSPSGLGYGGLYGLGSGAASMSASAAGGLGRVEL